MATRAKQAREAKKSFANEVGESSRQTAELAAFRRMMAVSEGSFSLSFCVYNVLHLRDELVDKLTNEFAGASVIRLPAGTTDVYGFVRQTLTGCAAPRAVFVLDLEHSLGAAPAKVLRPLNASRELWERFTCPVVFWLAEHAARIVSTQISEFWRYRSHTFEFTARPLNAGEMLIERFPGFEMVHGLPYEEKRFRRAELEQRIAEAGSPPAKQLLPHVLAWMYELAALHEIFNDWVASESVNREAVRLCQQEYGPDSSETAIAFSNLAQLLQTTNRHSEAEPLMRRALAIDEQSCGPDHPNVAIDLNNLASLLQDTNRLSEAEPLMRRALAIDEQSYGADHPNVAIRINNLAGLLKATNRLSEAEPLMRRALAIGEQSYGADHPTVGIRLNNLAQLLMVTNRLSEAEPLMRRALAIDEQSYGPDHPDVAISLNNLAQLLKATNRLSEAEPLLFRQVAIDALFQNNTGHEHPDMENDIELYREFCESLNIPAADIDRRIREARESAGPLPPIVAEVDRLLGPAKPIDDILADLDEKYRAAGKYTKLYFLPLSEPIAPVLDAVLGGQNDQRSQR